MHLLRCCVSSETAGETLSVSGNDIKPGHEYLIDFVTRSKEASVGKENLDCSNG